MDPLSHMAAGILIAECFPWSPGEKLIALGTVVVVSQLPDLDFLAKKIGSSTFFLTIHHKVSHSLSCIVPLAILIAWIVSVLFSVPFIPLVTVSIMTGLSHLFLDTLIHSSGICLFWPFSKKMVSLSLFMGPNPLTSSARCSERSLVVCLRCQLHGSLYSIPFFILVAGAVLSLIEGERGSVVSILVIALLLAYCGATFLMKRSALRVWRRACAADGSKRLAVAPGDSRPWVWYGLAENDAGTTTSFIDARTGTVSARRSYPIVSSTESIERSRETITVQDFLRESMFPYVSSSEQNGIVEVQWRELSYAFAPDIPLYLAKITMNESGDILSEEFRERW